MPPSPSRLTSTVTMFSRKTVRMRSNSSSREPPSIGDAERLALQVGDAVDAAAAAGDDGVAVFVVQDEDRLDRSTVGAIAIADQLVEIGHRDVAVALGDPRQRLGGAVRRRGRDLKV